ncbi:hypothetical protein FRB97_004777 [Tulasnella sp. 331]|nr:hypothetical protein FRB97_004777 [Tulasnella sp. 331]
MSRSVVSGSSATASIRKEDLAKLKRVELQGLCKEKSIRANGTNAAMIEALAAHFGGISIGGRPPAGATTPSSVRTPSRLITTPLSKTPVTHSMRMLLDSPESSPSSSTDSDHTTSTLPAVNSSRMVAQRLTKQAAAPVSKLKENQGGPLSTGKDMQSPDVNARVMKPKLEALKPTPRRQSRLSTGSAGLSIGLPKSTTPSRARASISSASGIELSNTISQALAFESLQKRLEQLSSAFASQNEELSLRIEAQDQKIEAQEESIRTLQTSLNNAHSLLATTRQVVVEELSLDVASCIQQTSDLIGSSASTDERLGLLESELSMKEGKVYQAMKEIGDLDVAMASERDRLSKLVEKVAFLAARFEPLVASPAFGRGSHSSGKRHIARESGVSEGMAMDFQMAHADGGVSGSASVDDPITPLTHGKRLSRASISAVIHALPQPIPRSSSNDNAHTGLRRDFRFPNFASDNSTNRLGSSSNTNNAIRKHRNTAGGTVSVRSRVQSSVDGEMGGVARQSTPTFPRVRTLSTLSAMGWEQQISTTTTGRGQGQEDSLVSRFMESSSPSSRTSLHNDGDDADYLRSSASGPPSRSGSAAFLKKDLLARSLGPSSSGCPSDISQDELHQSEEEQFSLLDQPQPSFSALGTDDDYAAEASTGGEEEDE